MCHCEQIFRESIVPTLSLLGSVIFSVGGLKSFICGLLELETDTPSNTKLGIYQKGVSSKAISFILIVVGVICIQLCKGSELK